MKKFISMILVLIMVFSLCACGGKSGTTDSTESQTGSQEKTFRVGYARYDITPTEAVPLGGFGNCDKRISTNVLRRLYVSCIALTDEQDYTVLMFSCDFINPYAALMDARPVISQQTGVPEHQILVNSSHTHAGPDTGSAGGFESIADAWSSVFNHA